MSLPDGAEYWQDVKRHFSRKGSARNPYYHLKNYNCGHYHVAQARWVSGVDCPACLRHLQRNSQILEQLQHAEVQHEAQEEARLAALPKCPKCNEPMIQRCNRTTKERFWGCADFPDCRGTRGFKEPTR